MLSGISTICFAASYTVALILELTGLVWRSGWRRFSLLLAAGGGLVAQTAYLASRAAVVQASPLSSPYDWCLLAAWLLMAIYLLHVFYHPASSTGLFVLPLVLALIAGAQWASNKPFAAERAHRFWGNVHGTFLLLGTVTVLIGFMAALMYLLQSHRLKTKQSTGGRFRLPSLEWLERLNNRALVLSALLIGIGLVSGVVLNRISQWGEKGFLLWTDPVVVSLTAMFVWLVAAEIFRLTYPPARHGRKIAYLNVASAVLLTITLALVLWTESGHQSNRPPLEARQALQTLATPVQGGPA
jgi:ABC-type uncharacterized transport system permease subunit